MTCSTVRPRDPRSLVVAVAMALIVGAAACGSDPFAINWVSEPDTVLLYSMARPEVNLASGFVFRASGRGAIRIERATATGTWDLALDTRGGELVFLPPGALGVLSRARVATLQGQSFAEVTDAPTDTAAYEGLAPVPVKLGNIYVVKTGAETGAFGSSCVYYAKIEPLTIDVAGGTLRFVYEASPVCNSLALVPPT